MKSPKELFIEARDNQLKLVAGHRVAVLKTLDDLLSFNGEDDYQVGLAAIVNAYPDGIVLTKIREVLPDSIILDKAIKALIEKKEITSEAYGKRSQLLKPVRPPAGKVEAVNTNPTEDPKWETIEVNPAKKSTPKPAQAAEETTED